MTRAEQHATSEPNATDAADDAAAPSASSPSGTEGGDSPKKKKPRQPRRDTKGRFLEERRALCHSWGIFPGDPGWARAMLRARLVIDPEYRAAHGESSRTWFLDRYWADAEFREAKKERARELKRMKRKKEKEAADQAAERPSLVRREDVCVEIM